LDAYVVEAALAKYERELAAYEATPDAAALVWAGAVELERVERKLAEAYQAWKSDLLDGARYFAMREDLDNTRARLRREHAAWVKANPPLDTSATDVRAAWATPVEEGGLTLAAKREFLARQLVAVQYLPERHPVTGRKLRRGFDPASVRLIWREPSQQPAEDASLSEVREAAAA
jgi:hypothetical protein